MRKTRNAHLPVGAEIRNARPLLKIKIQQVGAGTAHHSSVLTALPPYLHVVISGSTVRESSEYDENLEGSLRGIILAASLRTASAFDSCVIMSGTWSFSAACRNTYNIQHITYIATHIQASVAGLVYKQWDTVYKFRPHPYEFIPDNV